MLLAFNKKVQGGPYRGGNMRCAPRLLPDITNLSQSSTFLQQKVAGTNRVSSKLLSFSNSVRLRFSEQT